MSIIATLLLIIQISVFLTVMSYGMQSNPADVFYVIRRPGYLLRAMLSMFVIMPIVSVALVKLVDLDLVTEIALVSIAISPIPAFLPKNVLRRHGRERTGGARFLSLDGLQLRHPDLDVAAR